MSEYQKIVPIANDILKNHELCCHCLGRLFSKQLRLSSNKLLGQKLKKNFKSSQKCFICKNLFDNLNYFLKMMIDYTSDYSYRTFGIGITVKPSIIDRDDFDVTEVRQILVLKLMLQKNCVNLFLKKQKKF